MESDNQNKQNQRFSAITNLPIIKDRLWFVILLVILELIEFDCKFELDGDENERKNRLDSRGVVNSSRAVLDAGRGLPVGRTAANS